MGGGIIMSPYRLSDWVTQALAKKIVSMLLSVLERVCHLGTEPFFHSHYLLTDVQGPYMH